MRCFQPVPTLQLSSSSTVDLARSRTTGNASPRLRRRLHDHATLSRSVASTLPLQTNRHMRDALASPSAPPTSRRARRDRPHDSHATRPPDPPLTRGDVLTAAEVAAWLRVPTSTVYDLARRGHLPGH